LDHLKTILSGIQSLSVAASTPNVEEFDLAQMIAEVAAAEVPPEKATVTFSGHRPLVCQSDPSLVRLALGNGLRNAVDALDGVDIPEGEHPIVVTWGKTDIDYWIVVIDKGRGLGMQEEAAFRAGKTTKKAHAGLAGC
jgi:nitrogen fixation/metabolism regulation signal transduction histidine kinase